MVAIPWKIIIDASLPALIEQAGKLFKRADVAQISAPAVGEEASAAFASLRTRVERLEGLETEQARLLVETLEELQNVSRLAAGLQAKANMAVVIATAAVIGIAVMWLVKS